MTTPVTLTHDEQVALQVAAEDTWDAIAFDVLRGCDPGETLTRDDVISCVLDASHIVTYNPHLTPRVRQYLDHGDQEELYTLLRQVFTDTHYGM